MIGIYKFTNKINGKSYIGQSNNIERRFNDHLYYENNRDMIFNRALKKYGLSNFTFEVIEECSLEELDEKEIKWIAYYDSWKNGYNMTPGGRFNEDHKDEQEIINKYNELKSIQKVADFYSASRQTIRKILKNNKIEYNDKISELIPIEMIDPKTLQVIKVFPSVEDGAEYIHQTGGGIRLCLKGKHQTCGGYYWRKVGDNKEFTPLQQIRTCPRRAICQYDLQGNFIKEYATLSDANRAMGKSRSLRVIKEVCDNQRENAYGFIWRYKDGS